MVCFGSFRFQCRSCLLWTYFDLTSLYIYCLIFIMYLKYLVQLFSGLFTGETLNLIFFPLLFSSFWLFGIVFYCSIEQWFCIIFPFDVSCSLRQPGKNLGMMSSLPVPLSVRSGKSDNGKGIFLLKFFFFDFFWMHFCLPQIEREHHSLFMILNRLYDLK